MKQSVPFWQYLRGAAVSSLVIGATMTAVTLLAGGAPLSLGAALVGTLTYSGLFALCAVTPGLGIYHLATQRRLQGLPLAAMAGSFTLGAASLAGGIALETWSNAFGTQAAPVASDSFNRQSPPDTAATPADVPAISTPAPNLRSTQP